MYGETDEPVCMKCGRACTEEQEMVIGFPTYGELKSMLCQDCIREWVDEERKEQSVLRTIVSKYKKWIWG